MMNCNDTTLCSPTFAAAPVSASSPPVSFARPPVGIVATETAYVLTMDLPGVRKEDLEISVENRELSISGRRQRPTDAKLIHRESAGDAVRRVFELDRGINLAAISARFEDGVLALTLPKVEQAKPRKIEVAGD